MMGVGGVAALARQSKFVITVQIIVASLIVLGNLADSLTVAEVIVMLPVQ